MTEPRDGSREAGEGWTRTTLRHAAGLQMGVPLCAPVNREDYTFVLPSSRLSQEVELDEI